MIENYTVLFARVAAPGPFSRDVTEGLVAVVPAGEHVSKAVTQSLTRGDWDSFDLTEDGLPSDDGEDVSAVVVADDGLTSLKELIELAEMLGSLLPKCPLILVSNRQPDEAMAKILIGLFDSIVGFPFFDEKFHYSLRRLTTTATSFPMRSVSEFVPDKRYERTSNRAQVVATVGALTVLTLMLNYYTWIA